jgi:hypothetical protein
MAALAAIVLGLTLGVASGGEVRNLKHLRIGHEGPVILLFAVQALARGRIAGTSASSIGLSVWVLSCVALLGFLMADWRRPGVWVLCVGMALNLLVVLLNGGMPIAVGERLGDVAVSVARSASFYQLAGPGTLLTLLGDVVPLGAGAYQVLLSPGDALLAIGVAVFMVDGMLEAQPTSMTQATEA